MGIRIDIPEESYKLAVALSRPIDELGLSTRAYNSLIRWGLRTVGDVCKAYNEGELKKVRNLGGRTTFEIERQLCTFLAQYLPDDGKGGNT